jgi:MinD superfamily P-loop ATPase
VVTLSVEVEEEVAAVAGMNLHTTITEEDEVAATVLEVTLEVQTIMALPVVEVINKEEEEMESKATMVADEVVERPLTIHETEDIPAAEEMAGHLMRQALEVPLLSKTVAAVVVHAEEDLLEMMGTTQLDTIPANNNNFITLALK